jgi:gliding motility-associated-like protein
LSITGSTGPYTVSWNTSPVQTGTTATNLAPGNYIATITDANTCSSSFPVTIGLSNTITQTVSKTDATCTANGSITVSASGGTGSYEYSINGGTTWQSSNTFNNVAAGNYTVLSRVTGSAVCVTSSTAVTISLTNNLTLVQGLDTTICNGASFTRTLVSNASNFSWTPTTGVGNPAGISTSLSPTSTTTYTITASTLNCSLQRSITITVVSGATVNAGPDAIIIEGDRYQMSATGTAGNYTWTPATGLSSATVLNPVASPATTTNYVLRVVTTNGCTASDNMVLTVIPYCVKPLNAFTPNGDGINDKWLITNGNCLISASVEVFNRYGSSVYQSNDYKNDWQGTYKGENLPDGTYYYIIKYHLINGASQVLKGNVTILR